ncbi:CLUMA_CG003360, isoform A [Clunio marinus]|uniref:CLUMA_CG003360, isoform A n=1 Tax=Clunio marinus TaxID=568069 RepID=A0A1J1HTR8_9DIPT|nr:CLUMA_CG003360, isoform A [Clunio marinus]
MREDNLVKEPDANTIPSVVPIANEWMRKLVLIIGNQMNSNLFISSFSGESLEMGDMGWET